LYCFLIGKIYIEYTMAERTDADSKRLDIRKYPNRRYYDSTRSRHLTLDEIRSLIREGYDIQVTDSKTGADITGQVLTQIILELETPKLDLFPVPLLMRMIRVNDQLVKDFMEQYFNQALRPFIDYQQQFEQSLRQMRGLPVVYPPVSAWTKAMLHPFTAAFGSPKQETEKAPATPPQETAKLLELIQDLQKQIQEMKAHPKGKGKRKPGK
jgi:polyhydroxyalkanoate synthesis repressor PhaR